MDITLAKPTSIGIQGQWAQRFKAKREEITEACGSDITNSLKKVGASLGRREFIVNDIGRQAVESVQHKIETNLLNFLRKHFIGIPIMPMLGTSLWPKEGADKDGLETAARKALAPLIAG